MTTQKKWKQPQPLQVALLHPFVQQLAGFLVG